MHGEPLHRHDDGERVFRRDEATIAEIHAAMKSGELTARGLVYLGSNDVRAHFGLGEATRADSVHIVCPGGSSENVGPLPAGFVYVVKQGRGSRGSTTLGRTLAGTNTGNDETLLASSFDDAARARYISVAAMQPY